MNMKKLLLIFALISSFALAATAQTVVFTNVNVIPMDRERVLENQTVVARDGLITEVGDAKKVKIPKGATKIDGRGKYLIPGLMDMHVHMLSDDDQIPDALAEDELKIM